MDEIQNPFPPSLASEFSPGEPPAPPRQQFNLHVVFFGPYGLRSGWRLLVFAALFLFFLFCIAGMALFLARLASPSPSQSAALSPGAVIVQEVILLLTLFITLLTISRFENRSLDSYGLPFHRAFRSAFWSGALLGFVALTALLLAIQALHGFYFGSVALSGKRLVYYAALWALTFIMVGILEEYLSRGYMQFVLTRGMGFWLASIVTSLLFAALHIPFNKNESVIGLIAVFAVGLFFCLTLRRTGDLWFAVGFHASWDYAQSFVYGVPDSGQLAVGHLFKSQLQQSPAWLTGGSAGPEGSVLVFADIALAALVVARFYPKVKYPELAPAVPNPVPAESPSEPSSQA